MNKHRIILAGGSGFPRRRTSEALHRAWLGSRHTDPLTKITYGRGREVAWDTNRSAIGRANWKARPPW